MSYRKPGRYAWETAATNMEILIIPSPFGLRTGPNHSYPPLHVGRQHPECAVRPVCAKCEHPDSFLSDLQGRPLWPSAPRMARLFGVCQMPPHWLRTGPNHSYPPLHVGCPHPEWAGTRPGYAKSQMNIAFIFEKNSFTVACSQRLFSCFITSKGLGLLNT